MVHPKPEKIREVAARFRRAHERSQRIVSMGASNIYKSNKAYPHLECGPLSTKEAKTAKCGTIACHAGHYLLEKIVSGEVEYQLEYANFILGEELINEDLGISYGSVTVWASDNPELWGNPQGGNMFYYVKAFKKDAHSDETLTLLDIADWWDAVADRVEEAGVCTT